MQVWVHLGPSAEDSLHEITLVQTARHINTLTGQRAAMTGIWHLPGR